jgi:tetratricopeptide (TPR) repeat protein
MNDDRDWGAYVRLSHNQHTTFYLERAEANATPDPDAFNYLQREWANVETALARVYQGQSWNDVLRFMMAVERYLHLQGRWNEAAKQVAHALDALKHLQARWTFYAGLIEDEQGNYSNAERLYRDSLALAQSASAISIKADALRRLGWLVQMRGEQKTAETNYQEAVKLHNHINDPFGEARDLRQLGILYLQQGNLNAAEQKLKECLKLTKDAIEWDARHLQAGAWLDLGQIALRKENLEEAHKNFTSALTYAESGEDRLLLADIHFYMGQLAEEHDELGEAAQQYQKRLLLAEEIGDHRGEASALIALGTLDQELQQYDKAQAKYEKALSVGDPQNKAIAKMQLGMLARLQGKYTAAETHFQKALKDFKVLNLLQEACETLYQLGTLAYQFEKDSQARDYYNKALDLGTQANLPADKQEMIRYALKVLPKI